MADYKKEYPEQSELVIATVKSIFKQGAFVTLDEYENKRGMLPLSEISLKWVRNIRDYVKEGQKVVLLALRVNPERGHIDLSLRRVNEQQRKEKLKEVKQKQRAEKFLEQFARELSLPEHEVKEKIQKGILEKFDSLYEGLESIAENEKVLNEINIEEKFKKPLLNLIKKSIKAPLVEISGYAELKSYKEDGVDFIKKTLEKIENYKNDDILGEINVSYVSAPIYRVTVKAKDYKTAERLLKTAVDEGISFIKKNNGDGAFYRNLEDIQKK